MAFTYFFRDYYTLDSIRKHVVPFFAGRAKINIWDAGCAMGPEPYSLAIVLAENMGNFAFKNVSIYASDIDNSNLFEKIISDGVYSLTELERIPKDIFNKYFHKTNKDKYYRLDDKIRSRVIYKKHDLLTYEPFMDGFSLILCKNVLLHFNQEQRVEVLRMFHKTLVEGGFFATEQTQKMPEVLRDNFHQLSEDSQVFKKI